MHEISLGNKFDMNINIQPLICPKMQNIDVQMFGYFYSDGDRPYTSNNFEITAINQQSRVLEEFWIPKVNFKPIKIKIQRKTLFGHLVLSKTGAKRKTRVCPLNLRYPNFCAWMSHVELFIDALSL